MRNLSSDLRHAARSLRRSPGYAAAAGLTFALGIGATTAIFSVVQGVLLRPLPYPEPDRLAAAYARAGGGLATVSPPDFVDWRAGAESFAALAAWHRTQLTLVGDGGAELLAGARVTPGFFEVLGVRPALGRGFRPEEEVAGADRVAVLGHAVWRDRFGADPGVVGRTVSLDGTARRVVGVTPAGFEFPSDAALWVPRSFSADDLTTQRGAHYLQVVGRLRPGVAVEEAEAELEAIAARLESAFPDTNTGYSATVLPLREAIVGNVRPALLVLFGAVVLVLLLACANVAGLGLARAVDRERDLAVRAAFGAGRGRLLTLGLTEALLLSLMGAAAGLLLARWGADLILALRPDELPRVDEIRLDVRVAAFTAACAILAGLGAGLLPALRISRIGDLQRRLKEAGRGLTGGSGAATRRLLVAGEIALAVILLSGAGLLIRSFLHLNEVDPGFRTSGVLTFEVSLPDEYEEEPARARLFARGLLDRLQAAPGVEAAGGVFGLPLSGMAYGISVERLDGAVAYDAPGEGRSVQVRVATPGYFEAMGIPVLRGRGFLPSDREDAPPVAVVSASAGELLWPGEDPVDHSVELGTSFGLGGPRAGGRVVGVVPDVRHYGLDEAAPPVVYVAHAQFPVDVLSVALQTAGNPRRLEGLAREAVRELDPAVAVDDVRTVGDLVASSVGERRFYMALVGAFAGLALLLAGIGIYGLVAYTVRRRTGELGLRIALGAERGDILRLVLRQAAVLAAVGVAAGTLGALALTGTLRGLLFGLGPRDPATLAAGAAFLFAAVLVAAWLPARQAAAVDPNVALRAE